MNEKNTGKKLNKKPLYNPAIKIKVELNYRTEVTLKLQTAYQKLYKNGPSGRTIWN